ncbi:MAG: aminodeoxychorismate synthase component I [Proteobacteria bacterium]|nr:aminodeoxychorismate synthase component I [Pseudomonadota bacterium]
MSPAPFTETELNTLLKNLANEDNFVFLETTTITGENHTSYLFQNPVDRIIFSPGASVDNFFAKIETCLDKGFYLAGWFAYEFGYLLEPSLHSLIKSDNQSILAELLVFNKPLTYDHSTGARVDTAPKSVYPPSSGQISEFLPAGYRIDNLRLNESQADYLKKIARIKQYIAEGDTYQVNYTLKYLFDFSGSKENLYTTLRRNQSVSYAAYIRSQGKDTISFSPELFFRKQGSTCTVRPMKGTIKRGSTSDQDAELSKYLHQDQKNRSENIMIVDLLRNDLGRLCNMGEVNVQSLFDIETYETLHQMTSTITGQLRNDVSIKDLLTCLFPCGSVTGAPKIRTMEIIRELELEDRGVYTGGIGFITPARDAHFNVPIRTIQLNGNKGEMGVGSGVVYDSDPGNEWEECQLKARFLNVSSLRALKNDFELIETILWDKQSGYWLLDSHINRLKNSAGHFNYPFDEKAVLSQLERLAESFDKKTSQRVRLTLNSFGEISLTHSQCAEPKHRSPEGIYEQEDLPRVILSQEKSIPTDLMLLHKTTRRELYNRERAKAERNGFVEVIFANTRDEITEGSISNVFIRRGKTLYTPPVECGLLPGVFRRHLLENFSGMVKELIVTRNDLKTADAIFIGNSVRGLVQVKLDRL